jgi:ferredoxin
MSEAFITLANTYLTQYPTLHTGGFHDKDREDHWNFARVEEIKKYIERNYAGNNRKRGSYGLKHTIENDKNWTEDSNKYVSNGEGILAMLCAGYRAYDITPDSLNCSFKVNTNYYSKLGEKHAKKIWKKGLLHTLQYDLAKEQEAQLKEGALYRRSTYRDAYEETKKAQLDMRCIFCANCLPPKDYIPKKKCISVHAEGVIRFDQREQTPEQRLVAELLV